MRVSSPIVLYLPKQLVELLDYYLLNDKPKFNHKNINFYYVIYYLIESHNRHKNYEYVAINKQKLTDIIGSNTSRYMKYLSKYEFIINDKRYSNGQKSYWYKINSNYNKGIMKIEIAVDSRLYLRIKNNRIKSGKNQSKQKPYLYSMYKKFNRLKFDYDSAEKWINENVSENKKVYYLNSINQFNDINLRYFKRNKTNYRLDTNLTNLKRELRQFIEGDFINIDVKNSQPFLLFSLIDAILNINNNKYNTLCSYFHYDKLVETFGKKRLHEILKIRKNQEKAENTDLSLFNNTTQKGVFYDNFIQEYDNEITRKEVKNIMFKVLFSKNVIYNNYRKVIPYQNEKNIFKEVYPFVYDVIEILKENDNAKLSIYLQKIESCLFIDNIAKELVDNGIIPLTIHDSVIIERKHQEKALEIINKVFLKQIGMIPTLKIEKL